jgi:hypothetical protein
MECPLKTSINFFMPKKAFFKWRIDQQSYELSQFLPWFLDTGQTSVTRRFMSKIAQNGALLNKIFLSVEITDKNMEI